MDCCALCVQSLFLESLSGQQAQAAEVALAQAAARDAVGERVELEHMLTWLTGAHAEEAAMHRTFKAEVHCANISSSGYMIPFVAVALQIKASLSSAEQLLQH